MSHIGKVRNTDARMTFALKVSASFTSIRFWRKYHCEIILNNNVGARLSKLTGKFDNFVDSVGDDWNQFR